MCFQFSSLTQYLLECLLRFLGWLKGFIHDRNHSTENLVRGYARVTVIRRAPISTTAAVLQRYHSSSLSLPKGSFLRPPEERLERRSRSGRHEVQVRLSRRNHKHVSSIQHDEGRLWNLLRSEFRAQYATAIAMKFTKSTGVKCDGFPVTKGEWFGFDPHDNSPTRVVRVTEVFACMFDTRLSMYHCFVYMEVFLGAVSCNFTDYVVDVASTVTRPTVCIPLKSICSAFWLVPHWDTNVYPPKSCLLLVKHL